MLSEQRPDLAIRTSDGSRLAHERRSRLDEPVRPARLEVQRRPRRGRREGRLRRDPVRLRALPERRRRLDRFATPASHPQPMSWTIPAFVQYAREAAAPARRARLGGRVRARGDARPRHRPDAAPDLALRRRGLPDGLPVALQPRRVQPPRPERRAGPDGHALAARLPDRARGPQGAPRRRGSRTSRSAARTPSATCRRRCRRRARCTRAASCSGTPRASTRAPRCSRLHDALCTYAFDRRAAVSSAAWR